MQRYEKIQFKQQYSIKLIEEFFKKFPEERRGRKKFREKEIQNTKILIYEKILQKGLKIKADCVGSIKEKVDRELILEALKYEFSDTKELNTLITLSQSDNLRPYGKKVIQDLIKNNNLLLKQNYASLNFNVDEEYKDLFLQAAMNYMVFYRLR